MHRAGAKDSCWFDGSDQTNVIRAFGPEMGCEIAESLVSPVNCCIKLHKVCCDYNNCTV